MQNHNCYFVLNVYSIKTQTALIRNCWVQLFLLGFTQSSHLISISTVILSLTNFISNAIAQEKMPVQKLKKISEHVWYINEFFQDITKMELNSMEFAMIRFILLFDPCKY